ncbi:MAG TPA: Uma2 family endonuclease [Symbiobacteriaceae bacterium]|nr:Uma2 family endonuclease [Symbiobacteriaceae bacterium]
MSSQRVKLTYRDYLQMPEEQRWELLEGDLRMVPTPGFRHQQVLSELNSVLRSFVQGQGLGQVYFALLDVILDDDSVVQPDLMVILKERLSIIKPEGLRGAPHLVVEVLSPGTAHRDRGVKRNLYGRYGVQEYWMVDPQERTVEVTSLKNGALETVNLFTAGSALRSPLFPGLTLALDDLFVQ